MSGSAAASCLHCIKDDKLSCDFPMCTPASHSLRTWGALHGRVCLQALPPSPGEAGEGCFSRPPVPCALLSWAATDPSVTCPFSWVLCLLARSKQAARLMKGLGSSPIGELRLPRLASKFPKDPSFGRKCKSRGRQSTELPAYAWTLPLLLTQITAIACLRVPTLPPIHSAPGGSMLGIS